MRRLASLLVLVVAIAFPGCGGNEGSPSSPSSSTPTTTRVIGLSGNLAFGDVQIGSNATATLTITNSGSGALTITGMTVTGGLSEVLAASGGGTGTVAAGGSLNVTMRFTPTAAQTYSGTLTVNGDQTSGTNTIGVSGTGKSGSSTPSPPTPPAGTYTLTGTVTESGAGALSGANIEVRDGPDAKKTTTTDSSGKYTLSGLQAGSFTLRAWKTGYSDSDKGVTLPGTSRVDYVMQKSSSTPTPPPTPAAPDVEYVVTGVRSNIITISNSSEGTSQYSNVPLPWSYKFSGAHSGQFLYVSAQNDLASGCIKTQIYKRGALYKESESCGAYVIASASGSY